jgi:tRNA1(Val) A37 N6-methylase TrmN6
MQTPGFSDKYKNYFDAVFFSPPYFQLELYPGKNQSTVQYKTYEEWLDKYWLKTIQLCYYVLKPGGKMSYILSGYGSHNTKGAYDLLADMNAISQKIFNSSTMRVLPMYNKNVHVTSHRETAEKIIIFTRQ